ncbi:MAG: prephenate dehydrogenase/arogenate dehydrogenase family protein [Nitrosarchaeum sp.]|nr:prephenate dehydrogenase/arogenate dehydrogenase family protein [Nitrosarchaeum sp.]
MKESKVAVFGGAGNMGKLTEELFQNCGYETLTVDPKDPNSPTPAEAINWADTIFFSVLPIEKISDIISANENLFNENHIVLDNATEKRPLLEAYTRLLQKGVAICSTHPLCKHDQPLYGQLALIMQVGSDEISGKAREIGNSIYRNAGMKIVDFKFENHDEALLSVQIPHLIHRMMGRTFEKMGVDMKFLQSIATANFNLYELSMWRTLVQDPAVSAMIVANFIETSEGQEIISLMRGSFEEIVSNRDEKVLAESFKETYFNLGGLEIGPGMNDKTITVLERLANLGMKSFSFITPDDSSGSLVKKLQPFVDERVSITAVDSHRGEGQIRFDIGIEPGTNEEQLQKIFSDLQKMGCTIIPRSA